MEVVDSFMDERYSAEDLTALEASAKKFASQLRRGDAVAFHGPVGAGKTTFIAAICRALGTVDEASSPSFTIHQRYDGPLPVNHFDFYRIDDARELEELGLHEMLSADAVHLIEWPENAKAYLPKNAMHVWIDGAGESARLIRVERP